jgi:retinol dehydrogenase 12
VYIAARDETKAHNAIARLKEKTSHEALFLQLNLGDLKSIKAAAAKFKECAHHVYIEHASC